MSIYSANLGESGRSTGMTCSGWAVYACFLASAAWAPLIFLHVATVSTDVLTPLASASFYGAMVAGGLIGLALATIAAVASWFSPWPRGRSFGVAARVWLSLAIIAAPAYALIAPSVVSRLMEWKAFGWSAPVWTRTLVPVMGFRPRDHKGRRSYVVDIDPYGEWEDIPVSETDYRILAAANRPDRPWNYCIAILEQQADGIARMQYERAFPADGESRVAECPAANS